MRSKCIYLGDSWSICRNPATVMPIPDWVVGFITNFDGTLRYIFFTSAYASKHHAITILRVRTNPGCFENSRWFLDVMIYRQPRLAIPSRPLLRKEIIINNRCVILFSNQRKRKYPSVDYRLRYPRELGREKIENQTIDCTPTNPEIVMFYYISDTSWRGWTISDASLTLKVVQEVFYSGIQQVGLIFTNRLHRRWWQRIGTGCNLIFIMTIYMPSSTL